jgi:hypothetical protein
MLPARSPESAWPIALVIRDAQRAQPCRRRHRRAGLDKLEFGFAQGAAASPAATARRPSGVLSTRPCACNRLSLADVVGSGVCSVLAKLALDSGPDDRSIARSRPSASRAWRA